MYCKQVHELILLHQQYSSWNEKAYFRNDLRNRTKATEALSHDGRTERHGKNARKKLGTCILSKDLLVHWLAITLAGNQKLKCDMNRHALLSWSLAGCTSTGIGGLCRAPERTKDSESEKEKDKERARGC